MALKGQWKSLDGGRLGKQRLSLHVALRELSWWQALLPPVAFTPAPVALTPFYEVICVVSIERRLLNTSTHFVLARKQAFTADLFKAKIHFLIFFFFFW